ncbi:phage head-tail joining protein [Sphingomonas sp. Xoc002]|uniref:phage head-tail joining protein n=1 Tax=Sphingomonas sp. Xoc002 TaxID=2837624 RepID=UPI003D16252C
MAFTQSDVDAMQAAIGSGVRKVTFADGRSTEYQNLDAMLSALNIMRGDVAKAANAATRNSRRLIIGRVGRCR